MLKACFANPLFWFIGFCMLLTASTELATTQRISSLLEQTVSNPILVLAFINGIMMVGRLFAGDIVHRLSITKMLLFSAVFSFLGLLWLSTASGMTSFLAAAVFAIGVCYFWPTMLSFVAEKIPSSGALGLSLMGGLGMFSVSIVLWAMGLVMDMDASGSDTLYIMALLPAILIVLFGARLLVEMKSAKSV
jgi:fucose permease